MGPAIRRSRGVAVVLTAAVLAFASWELAAIEATGQAPMLQKLVEAGKLPPVKERVGRNPLVIEPAGGVASYGGTLRLPFTGASDVSWIEAIYGYDQLVRWDGMAQNVLPNIAESWEAAPDGRSYTFKLREGLRWSDGQPFTTRDIMFWWNDVQFEKGLAPNFRAPFIGDPNAAKLQAVDERTVRFEFTNPQSLFMYLMATHLGNAVSFFPAHYLEPFHIKHNPKADEDARKAGMEGWATRFNQIASPWFNPDRPTMYAWKTVRPVTDTRAFTLVRNPYYWKVDDKGNQLPYIDEIANEIVQDREVMLLKALNGEIDYIARYINTLPNKAVLVDNEKRAGISFFEIVDASPTYVVLHLNQTHRNPVLREVFDNKKFRIALSHALDRQEIIDIVFAGQGEPYQVAPRPESEFYDKDMAKQYTQYDPALANKLLDEAGYARRDANGLRLGPDGKPITFIMTVRGDRQPYVDLAPFVTNYWRAVGINADFRVLEKSAYLNQRDNNQHDGIIEDGDGGMIDAMIVPRAYLPIHTDSAYGTGWVHHYLKTGVDQEAPPPHVQRGLDVYTKMQLTADPAEQKALYRQLLAMAKDNFLSMGLGLPVPDYGAHTKRLRNVPPVTVKNSRSFSFPGPSIPAQWAIKD